MSALIYNVDRHSSQALANILRELNYSTVFETRSAVQFKHILKREGPALRLIVNCGSHTDNFRVQIFSILRQSQDLAATPLILVSESSSPLSGPVSGYRFRRADYVLHRPFGIDQFYEAIKGANEQRSRSRDILVMLSAREQPEALEALYEFGNQIHWRAIEHAQNLQELRSLIKRHGFRVGTILIDGDQVSPEVTRWLSRFKKTRQGVLTPAVFLSRDPAKTAAHKLNCEMFCDLKFVDSFDLVTEWEPVFKITSNRLIYRSFVRQQVVFLRQDLKERRYRRVQVSALRLTKKYPCYWELYEVLGHAYENLWQWQDALECYQKAIELNPCAPFSHLRRMRIASLEDQNSKNVSGQFIKQFCELAVSYCPNHQEIRNQSQALMVRML